MHIGIFSEFFCTMFLILFKGFLYIWSLPTPRCNNIQPLLFLLRLWWRFTRSWAQSGLGTTNRAENPWYKIDQRKPLEKNWRNKRPKQHHHHSAEPSVDKRNSVDWTLACYVGGEGGGESSPAWSGPGVKFATSQLTLWCLSTIYGFADIERNLRHALGTKRRRLYQLKSDLSFKFNTNNWARGRL